MSRYRVVPLSKTAARQFVQEHHRHNEAPSAMQVSFAVGLEVSGSLVAVATAGRPVARMLDDGQTLEVNRVCVEGEHRNANSALYGAIGRAAKALGYGRLVTYTLRTESGVSLRAAGFGDPIPVGDDRWGSPNRSWATQSSRDRVRSDVTLWGERRNAANEPKYRWERVL